MKNQFLHEHHRRQEKALKPDYREEMQASARSHGTWSGVDAQACKDQVGGPTNLQIRLDLLAQITSWHFTYGLLAYSPRMSLLDFARLNKLPPEATDTLLEMKRLADLRKEDMPLILAAIRKGTVRRHQGWLREVLPPYVDWAIPESAKVELVSRKFPKKRLQERSSTSQQQTETYSQPLPTSVPSPAPTPNASPSTPT